MTDEQVDVFADPQEVDLLADPDGAEVEALGAALCDPSSVRSLLRPSHFTDPRHATVYSAGLAVFARGEQVDIVTVGDELRASGELERHFSSALDFGDFWRWRDFIQHARPGAAVEVLELARLRALRDAGLSLAAAAERGEPEAALEHAKRAQRLARWAAPTRKESAA